MSTSSFPIIDTKKSKTKSNGGQTEALWGNIALYFSLWFECMTQLTNFQKDTQRQQTEY